MIFEVSNPRQLGHWLEDKPAEWAMAFTVRAALRVLPVAWALDGLPYAWASPDFRDSDRFQQQHCQFMLGFWRGSIGPMMKIKFPNIESSILEAAISGGNSSAVTYNIFAELAKSIALVTSTGLGGISFDRAQIASFNISGRYVGPLAKKETEIAAMHDFMAFSEKSDPATLIFSPLWINGTPDWAKKIWRDTKSDLLALNEDWDVWTRWYDALLEGREPESEAMAIARVSLPEALWAQGPKAVNAEIKRLEEEQYIKNSNFPSAATQSFPQTPREWDIFISYSAHDEAEAREICEIIESTGLTTFARFKDVAMDDNFIAEIERGVARSGRLVALFSPNYAVSKRCQSELSAARRVNPQRETEKSIVLILHPTQLETGDSVYNSLFGLTGDASSLSDLT